VTDRRPPSPSRSFASTSRGGAAARDHNVQRLPRSGGHPGSAVGCSARRNRSTSSAALESQVSSVCRTG
jgi:hypothetical protein